MRYIVGMVLALGIGAYVGPGFPGLPGREDRVVHRRGRRVHQFAPLDWLKPRKR